VSGRTLFPQLRLVFAAAAGLAPVHHERHAIRGGTEQPVDPEVYVDSSGYGPRALDAVVRVLGIDALVLGSDRPYAAPLTELFGEAATQAIRVTNPARLLGGATRAGEHAWPSAS
jgi:predicted TIM-barrel fold metal-dependent hydrolase